MHSLCSNPCVPFDQKYRRALVVLPYISVVAERTAHLAAVVAQVGIVVRGYCVDATTTAPLSHK